MAQEQNGTRSAPRRGARMPLARPRIAGYAPVACRLCGALVYRARPDVGVDEVQLDAEQLVYVPYVEGNELRCTLALVSLAVHTCR
jgi:hypothetical protein